MPKSISEITLLWDRVLDRLKTHVTEKHVYDTFFQSSYVHTIIDNTLIIVTNSNLSKTMLSTTYEQLIKDVVNEITQSNYDLKFITKDEIPVAKEASFINKPTFFANAKIVQHLTFDNFIVGDTSNLQAFQASLMIASNPGKLYNPLFIYSASGLGKTHLLHAIGNYVKDNSPSLRVLYISADDFVDEFIKFAKGDKENESMKDYFKSVDVLLVDDVQFLAEKPKTEEMFFHIFNNLVNANKQIVLTSDRHPSELKGLESRLVSRFSQGLQINITVPDLKTCEEILRAKISANNLDVRDFDDDVITFFAEKFGSNVRELEGSLNRLLFYVTTIKKTKRVTMDIALDSVQSLISVYDAKTKLTESKVVAVVADYYNLTSTQLTGRNRNSQIAMARHIAMYLVRELMDLPFARVGKVFGRDHTTVISAVDKVEKLLKTDQELLKALDDLKTRLV
jgi:chromosomal replication initiator protein